jgi:hypothetical protein
MQYMWNAFLELGLESLQFQMHFGVDEQDEQVVAAVKIKSYLLPSGCFL